MIPAISLDRNRKSGGEHHDTRRDKTRDMRRQPERTVSLSDTAAATDQRARFSLHDAAATAAAAAAAATATTTTDQRAVRVCPRSLCPSTTPPLPAAVARYVALYYLRCNSQRVRPCRRATRRNALVIHMYLSAFLYDSSRACSLRTCTSL